MAKGISYFIFFTLLFSGCKKETPEDLPPGTCNYVDFYYYNNQKTSLGEMADDYILVAFDSAYSKTDIQKFISLLPDFDQNYRYTLNSFKMAALKLNKQKTCEEISDIIFKLNKSPMVQYANFTMKTNDCTNAFGDKLGNRCVNSYSNYFYVKVYDENNLKDLFKIMGETKTELVEPFQTMPKWFVLKATKNSKGDGLKMANYFYESKLFIFAEPDLGLKYAVE